MTGPLGLQMAHDRCQLCNAFHDQTLHIDHLLTFCFIPSIDPAFTTNFQVSSSSSLIFMTCWKIRSQVPFMLVLHYPI